MNFRVVVLQLRAESRWASGRTWIVCQNDVVLTLYKMMLCHFLWAGSRIHETAPFRFETMSLLAGLEDACARCETTLFYLTGTTSFTEGSKGIVSTRLETLSWKWNKVIPKGAGGVVFLPLTS